MAGTGALNAASGYFVTLAVWRGSPSMLAPFFYSQIFWATLIGWLGFATLPDRWTWLGTAIIIASGIYIWHRERFRRRLAQTQP